jgi:hypothetical protein
MIEEYSYLIEKQNTNHLAIQDHYSKPVLHKLEVDYSRREGWGPLAVLI